MKDTTQREQDWNEIRAKLIAVKEAYRNFIEQCHALAASIYCDPDYVIRHALPAFPRERDKGGNIREWIEDKKTEILNDIENRREEQERAAKRNALIAKLGLSEEEIQLLEKE